MTPTDPDYDRRVRTSFGKQNVMTLFGASLTRVAPGEVDVALPVRPDLCQQHGFVHAGVVTSIVDTACGYAALSLMPPGAAVLSVEFKTNLLAPAKGTRLIAKGRVMKSGRTLFVCAGDVFSDDGTLVATMLATMMVVKDRPGLVD